MGTAIAMDVVVVILLVAVPAPRGVLVVRGSNSSRQEAFTSHDNRAQ